MNRAICVLALLSASGSHVTAGPDVVDSAFASHCVRRHGQDGKVKGHVDLKAVGGAFLHDFPVY